MRLTTAEKIGLQIAVVTKRIDPKGNCYPRLPKSYWARMHQIKQDRKRAMDKAYDLLAGSLIERFVGVTLLDALFNPTETNERDQAKDMMRRLAELARQPQPDAILEAIADTLGRPFMAEAQPALLMLSRHSNPDVRLAATQHINSTTTDHATKRVVKRLIELSKDSSADVRNWACFALGSLEVDSQQVRDALLARITDRHLETKCEAFRALAALRDERGILPLRDFLSRQYERGGTIWRWAIQAAVIYGDPRLFDVLSQIAEWWNDKAQIQSALNRCDPDPLMRAKTPEDEWITKPLVWHLLSDSETVGYTDDKGRVKTVVGLRRECQLLGVYSNEHEMVLKFERRPDTKPFRGSRAVWPGDQFIMLIKGIESHNAPAENEKAQFWRLVYDRDSSHLIVRLTKRGYRLKGTGMTIEFWWSKL